MSLGALIYSFSVSGQFTIVYSACFTFLTILISMIPLCLSLPERSKDFMLYAFPGVLLFAFIHLFCAKKTYERYQDAKYTRAVIMPLGAIVVGIIYICQIFGDEDVCKNPKKKVKIVYEFQDELDAKVAETFVE